MGKHLVVFLNGLLGHPTEWNNFKDILDHNKDLGEYQYLVITANSLFNSLDGILVGGDRAYVEITAFLDKNIDSYSKISLIGHSLGGLYARRVAFLLQKEKFFGLHPYVYASFATPHCGVRTPVSSCFAFIGGKTISELLLKDKNQILSTVLCNKSHIQALLCFEKRVLYANLNNDINVSYSTSSIQERKIRDKPKMSQSFPHITEASFNTPSRKVTSKREITTPFYHCLQELSQLSWYRFDVYFERRFFFFNTAHVQIHNATNLFDSGEDIVKHFATLVMTD